VCAVLKKRRVAATPYPAYGIEEKVGFVGKVSAAPPGVTYSDHRFRPASFALYSAASARAMISAPTGWTAGAKPSRCVCGIKKTPGGGYALPGLRDRGKRLVL